MSIIKEDENGKLKRIYSFSDVKSEIGLTPNEQELERTGIERAKQIAKDHKIYAKGMKSAKKAMAAIRGVVP